MFGNFNENSFDVVFIIMVSVVGLSIGFAIGAFRSRKPHHYFQQWAVENIGETLVREFLKEYCKNNNAHVLNCVTLRLEDGSTTQIDHILVSAKGVFVIETKHFKGWIFGDSKSRLWTQVIYNNKYEFQNPVFQNYKHVKEVQRILSFLESRFIYNIVVFSGEAVFKTAKIDNVCYLDELISAIEGYSDGVLSLNRIQFCVGRLECMRLKLTQKTDVEHQLYLIKKFGR